MHASSSEWSASIEFMEGTELSKYNSFCLKQLTVMCKLDTMKSYNRLRNIEQIVFFFTALSFIFCSGTLLVISISILLWSFKDTFLWVLAKRESSQDTWEGRAWQVFAEVTSRGKPPLQLLPRPYCLSKKMLPINAANCCTTFPGPAMRTKYFQVPDHLQWLMFQC